MNVRYAFGFDGRGQTAEAGDDDHIRQLIEQVLFTAPGERVMRPDFGSGLMQLVFAPNSSELAATTQFLVQGALQQWLGHLITIQAVEVSADEAALTVTVQYVVRRTEQSKQATFQRGTAGA